MCPTQCSRYQRRFAYTSPLNSARCGIPLTPIFGTAGRLTIICRNFVSITADVFRRRTARRIGKTGFTSRVRKWRTRWTPCLIARANGCGAGVSAEGELERVVNAALNRFFQDTHRWISDAFAADVRVGIDALLVVPESAAVSGFEGLKADPGKAGVHNLQAEIEKLTRIRAIGVGTEPFANVPWKVFQMLKRRASKETASEMRDHSNVIRYALMASYLYVRLWR